MTLIIGLCAIAWWENGKLEERCCLSCEEARELTEQLMLRGIFRYSVWVQDEKEDDE